MKKVIYILNLLFLTLIVFGGSVFAAAPEYYLDGNEAVKVPDKAQQLTNNSSALSEGWYYIDQPVTKTNANIYVESGADVNIIVVGTPTITLTNRAIFVPDNGSLSFYGETTEDVTSTTALLTINGTYNGFVIGNYVDAITSYGFPDGNFGDITFNSGTYTVVNKSSGTSGPAIGSSTTSGGTITVNAAATVSAWNDWHGGNPIVAVGVGDSSQNCTIQVKGGLLQAAYNNVSPNTSRTISAGKAGKVIISGQGKIFSAVNPNNSGDNGTWNIDSGIAGYTLGSYNSAQWAAVVGGTVNLPVETGVLQQDLTPPATANTPNPACWNLLTVNPGAVLNLGTTAPDGTTNEATLLVGYNYGTPETPSSIENYGTVNVIDLDQNATYPSAWNNNPGSVLTMASGAELALYQGTFTNYAAAQGKPDGQVTVNGNLNITPPGKFTNSGSATVGQTGTIDAPAVNGSNAPDSPDASLTLNGEITENLTNNSSGSVTVGPIGTVAGNLTNNEGGTVTSQNPCYYGGGVFTEQFYNLISSLIKCSSSITCLITR